MDRWREIFRSDRFKLKKDQRISIEKALKGFCSVVVEEKVSEEPIPVEELTVELKQSRHCENGYYCAISHQGRRVAVLGVGDPHKMSVEKGYRVEKPKGATVSFRLFGTS